MSVRIAGESPFGGGGIFHFLAAFDSRSARKGHLDAKEQVRIFLLKDKRISAKRAGQFILNFFLE